MRPVRFCVLSALLVLTGCYGAADAGKSGNAGPAGLAGAPAQSVDLSRIDGKHDGVAEHRGSVVLLNLWTTWCPPCQQEMPALERFSRQERGKVTVIAVDQGESRAEASAFAAAHGVTFPVLIDEGQRYGAMYHLAGLPTTIVIGRDGRIVSGTDGPLTLAEMHAAVAPALK